ncbi:MAG: sulfite exporter TauE/SafE family protein [Haloechinothrix sp.]
MPVGGFLAGKLRSYTLLGALLGLLGGAAQLNFRTRAFMQIGAGVVMVLLAANLLGVRALRRPQRRPR